MTEEIKIYIGDYKEVEEKLKSLGAIFIKEVSVTDTYFNQPEGKVLKITENDKGFFLSQLQREGEGFQIIKRGKIENPEQVKKEYEAQYGIKCILKIKRRLWNFEEYTIKINLYEDLGNFLIIEGEKVTKDVIIDKLGIKNPKYLTVSFDKLKEQQIQNKKIKALLLDFSRVLIFPKDTNFKGLLNDLYRKGTNTSNFNFYETFVFNKELLSYLQTLKSTYSLNIYTTDILQNDPAAKEILDPIFDHIFSANEFGLSKKYPEGYKAIAGKLGVQTNEILFIDDTAENINAAKNAGLQTLQFISNKQLINWLNEIGK